MKEALLRLVFVTAWALSLALLAALALGLMAEGDLGRLLFGR